MSLELGVPEIKLPEPELNRRFDHLQQRLVPLWKSIESLDDVDAQTVVVVPSLTVDFSALQGSVLQAYEERFLFLLLLLRQPSTRLIYVTSQPIHPNIVDYYLGLLPGVISSHARDRLHLLAPHDGAPQPLSIKLLQRPRLLEKIRSLIADPKRAHLVPFNTTRFERDLALRLGIPLYGADPRHLHLGTKSGCRQLFAECDMSHPLGFEDLTTKDDVISALLELKQRHPDAVEAMVKHNDGVSGEGNAIANLRKLDVSSRAAAEERLWNMKLEAEAMGHERFVEKLLEHGGIVEERIVGEEITSPSAQLRVTPLGTVELLSTHDQLLGGAQGQKYVGCLFPASSEYAALIGAEALKLKDRLVEEGVLGRFAVDFVCARGADGWKPYAIELNLRKGGTTHPFLTLQFLTRGQYDGERGEFQTAAGQQKCYVATDGMTSEAYRAFTPDDLFDVAVRHELQYDQTTQTGVVFHMLSAVGDQGRLGLTAVGNSLEQAQTLYEKMEQALTDEAKAARTPAPLPE